jgi:hypothetical protein
VSYAYGTVRQTDIITGESFWGDFDRRHSFNASALYRLPGQTSLSFAFRTTSGAPLPGYFTVRDRGLFVGDRRNQVRLPAYPRLDTRIQRTFLAASLRVTLFAEMLNILNRANQGFWEGMVPSPTGQVTGFTRSMLARRASAGFVIDF